MSRWKCEAEDDKDVQNVLCMIYAWRRWIHLVVLQTNFARVSRGVWAWIFVKKDATAVGGPLISLPQHVLILHHDHLFNIISAPYELLGHGIDGGHLDSAHLVSGHPPQRGASHSPNLVGVDGGAFCWPKPCLVRGLR